MFLVYTMFNEQWSPIHQHVILFYQKNHDVLVFQHLDRFGSHCVGQSSIITILLSVSLRCSAKVRWHEGPKSGCGQGMGNIFPRRLSHSDLVPRMGNRMAAIGLTSEAEMDREVSPHAMLRTEWCRRLQGFLWQSLKLSATDITVPIDLFPRVQKKKGTLLNGDSDPNINHRTNCLRSVFSQTSNQGWLLLVWHTISTLDKTENRWL